MPARAIRSLAATPPLRPSAAPGTKAGAASTAPAWAAAARNRRRVKVDLLSGMRFSYCGEQCAIIVSHREASHNRPPCSHPPPKIPVAYQMPLSPRFMS